MIAIMYVARIPSGPLAPSVSVVHSETKNRM